MDSHLIEQHYDLRVTELRLIDRHFETEIYIAHTGAEKYLVKVMPLFYQNVDNEGQITEHLHRHGMNVAQFLRTRQGSYVTKLSENQFTVQEFVEGNTLPLNSAPEWFLEKTADFLGKTTLALQDYSPLPLQFGRDFFTADNALQKKRQYISELEKANDPADRKIVPIYVEQLRHLERIAQFQIDTDRLTYANSHGDFHIGQAMVKDQDLTVIDWASACRLPIVLDIATSYVFASPRCIEGAVDAEGLSRYIRTYTKHAPLTEYDIQALPYVLYFWYCICNYSPRELASIASSDHLSGNYQPIAALIKKLLGWLYEHVEELSDELIQACQRMA